MLQSKTIIILVIAFVIVFILAIIVFFCIGMLRQFQLTSLYQNIHIPKTLLSQSYNNLHSGDIILFTSDISPTRSFAVAHLFTHVGMVIREKNQLFITEGQVSGRMTITPYNIVESNMFLTPLLPRLKFYIGRYFIVRLNPRLSEEMEENLKQFIEDIISKKRYQYPSLLDLIFRKKYKIHCFQYVALLLDFLGITVDLANRGLYQTTYTIGHISQQELYGGFQYSNPVELLYDIGTVKLL